MKNIIKYLKNFLSTKSSGKLDNKLVINITEEDCNKSSGYFSNEDCYLATALKRLGYYNVVVTGTEVSFYKDSVFYAYRIDNPRDIISLMYKDYHTVYPVSINLTKMEPFKM